MPVMITLNKIYSIVPYDSWDKVLNAHGHLGMDTEFPLSSVLDSNDLEDTLWCFEALPEYIEIPKRFAIWCAREVQHLMTDKSNINALDIAERYLDGNATREELEAAYVTADVTADADAFCVNTAAVAAAFCARYVASYEIIYVLEAASTSRAAAADMEQKQIDKLKEMLN